MLKGVRAHVIVTGLVQRVYYRVMVRQEACTLGITGWVKNRPDGTVEAMFEGEEEKVVKLIDWCRQGTPASKVSSVQIEWGDFRSEYQNFRIIS